MSDNPFLNYVNYDFEPYPEDSTYYSPSIDTGQFNNYASDSGEMSQADYDAVYPPQGGGDYLQSGYNTGNSDYSRATHDAEDPPAGAVRNDGKNWLGALGNIIAPLATSLVTPYLNNAMSGGQLQQGRDLLGSAGRMIGEVTLPNLAELMPQLQLQVNQGAMTPAEATAILQEASRMNNVSTDATSLNGQRAALSRLNEIANQSGMTDADRAQLAQTMNQTNANAASQRASQLQQLGMQGNAGTGAELATRLSGAQSTANSNAAAGASVASSAQARALAALQANLSGNAALNSQLFSQDADKAKAQDAVNAFNAGAKNTMASANAERQQQANLAAFNATNTINANNTTIANNQRMMPMQTAQQQYANEMERASKGATAANLAGDSLINQGNKQLVNSAGAGTGTNAQVRASGGEASGGGGQGGGGDSGFSGVVNTIGQIGQAVPVLSKAWDAVSSWFSDEDLKTGKQEMSDSEVDNMLGELTAYKYRYKGSNTPHQGIIAQDLEKTPMKSAVVNTPAGKVVNGNDTMGKALASLANMNGRLRNLEGK